VKPDATTPALVRGGVLPSRAAAVAVLALCLGVAVVPAAPGGAPAAGPSLRGAIDLHCHSGPDTLPRALNDLQLVRQARDAGMRALVLKNHFTATADRAQLAMEEVGGIEVFGGIVLNRAVGGINAEAVRRMAEMEGRRGRIVWLPTLDAENQVRFAGDRRAGVAVVRDGRPVPELHEVFIVIAQHDLVLATGHSSAEESLVLVAAARQAGVKRLLVTHVLAEAIRATPDLLRRMAELGALLECTWLTHSPGTGGAINVGKPVPVAEAVRVIRSLGAEHVVISSDLGQRGNPPHPEGLRAFVSALQGEGVTAQEIDLVLRRNPARLLGL
jgi:hypothetical protein